VGSPGDRRPREIHRQAALATLTRAAEKIGSGEYQLIILDEICCAIDLGLLDLSKVMELIETRPPSLHLILTGRNAPRQLVDRADLVTEMKEIRHPFSQGLPARAGIDY